MPSASRTSREPRAGQARDLLVLDVDRHRLLTYHHGVNTWRPWSTTGGAPVRKLVVLLALLASEDPVAALPASLRPGAAADFAKERRGESLRGGDLERARR